MTVKYVLHDRSFLLPYVTKYIVQPLVKRIPRSVSANSLTLSSLTCGATGFTIALATTPSHLSLFAVMLCFAGYMLCDNLDGPHARATGTTSPLGEFLDHWLDSVNGLFVFVGSAYALGVHDARTLGIVATLVASMALTFWEQRVTGRMYMGRFGTLEGLTCALLLLLTFAILGPDAMYTFTWRGYDGIDLFVLLAVFAGGATVVGPMGRTRKQLGEAFEILAFLGCFVAWGLRGAAPMLAIFTLVALTGPLTGGRRLMGRVVKDHTIGPPPVVLYIAAGFAAAGALGVLPAAQQPALAWGLVAVIAVQVALDFRRAVRLLGEYVRPNEVLRFLLP